MTNRKLTVGDKAGYGFAAVGDNIAYDFIGIFLLVFLTDIAGISPAFAGTIFLLAVIWDAITDPIIGHVSDIRKRNGGKRSNFLLFAAVPLGLTMVLLFTKVDVSASFKNTYYLIMAIAFWLSYTCFSIPYYALGSSLTSNYDERTQLRSYSQSFGFVGILFSSALPPAMLGIFINMGQSEEKSWQSAAIALALLSIIPIIATALISRRKETPLELTKTEGKKHGGNLLKQILDIMRIKPYLLILLAALIYYMGYIMQSTSAYYFMQSDLGLHEFQISTVYAANSVALIIFTVLLGKFAVKFDKKKVFTLNLALAACLWILAYILGVDSMAKMIVFFCIYALGSATYWTLMYTFVYDVVELDELKYGVRRDGLLVSYFGFTNKLGAALAGQIVGIMLEVGGYNPDVVEQTEGALAAIEKVLFLGPGLAMLITGLMIWKFPIDKKKYERICELLEQKRQGRANDLEDINKMFF